jgi:DNA-binding transcriptional LysR family regulator
VSRRIARLERELGQELIRRSSRTFKLTEAGDALYHQSAPAIRDLAEATRSVSEAGSEPQGDLKLTARSISAARRGSPRCSSRSRARGPRSGSSSI